jgi:hypothetical protein
MSKPNVTDKEAEQMAKKVGLDLTKYPLDLWKFAMQVELEHGTVDSRTNVTNNDLLMTAKIALAHIIEIPDYYQRLKIMEQDAEAFWEKKERPNLLTTPSGGKRRR